MKLINDREVSCPKCKKDKDIKWHITGTENKPYLFHFLCEECGHKWKEPVKVNA